MNKIFMSRCSENLGFCLGIKSNLKHFGKKNLTEAQNYAVLETIYLLLNSEEVCLD